MRAHKMILTALVVTVAGSGIWIAQRPAAADAFSCSQHFDATRVWDRERNACGWLTVDNPDWRRIGSPAWNDRIDQFGNDNFDNNLTICLYRDINYTPADSFLRLPPGWSGEWNNTVSSNRWRNTGC